MSRFVVMGVSGCGKSEIGRRFAAGIGASFHEGDDLHPPANIAKMASGTPLDDDDRWPWLDKVAATLSALSLPAVVTCSALKRAYRDRIRAAAGGPVRFVHLAGPREVIAARMKTRAGHFMPHALLDSQFAALEPPTPNEMAITVSINQPIDRITEALLTATREELS